MGGGTDGPRDAQTIFQDAFPAYEQTHPLPAHVRRAARAIMPCRTAVLGGHVQACPDGHLARIWYHSCRHRSCPQCAYRQTEHWLALQQARLLACDHSHVIFTLPHDRNPLWLANVPVMTTLLFQAVRDTLGTLLADPKFSERSRASSRRCTPGVRPWCCIRICHGLVTGGGLTPAGQWVAVRHGFLLPGTGGDGRLSGEDGGGAPADLRARARWPCPSRCDRSSFVNLLNRLGHPTKTKWHVRCMERSRHGAGVVTSLARSLRGGPIKNARLVAWDGDRVTFLHRARQEEAEGRSLSPQRDHLVR